MTLLQTKKNVSAQKTEQINGIIISPILGSPFCY